MSEAEIEQIDEQRDEPTKEIQENGYQEELVKDEQYGTEVAEPEVQGVPEVKQDVKEYTTNEEIKETEIKEITEVKEIQEEKVKETEEKEIKEDKTVGSPEPVNVNTVEKTAESPGVESPNQDGSYPSSTTSGYANSSRSLDEALEDTRDSTRNTPELNGSLEADVNGLEWPAAPIVEHQFLEEIMEDLPSAHLLCYNVAPAFHPSDYKRCYIYSITLTFIHGGNRGVEPVERKVLAKMLPPKLAVTERLLRDKIFQREVALYGTTFPDMMRRLRSARDRDMPPFFPHMFPVSEPSTLVLEDLRAQQYLVVPPHRMLDGGHSVAAILALARFHAASVAAHYDCAGSLERFDEVEFVSNKRDELLVSVEGNILAIAKEMSTWEGCEPYQDRVVRLGLRIVNWLIRFFKFGKQHFHALIHGAFWTNNILFHYDDYGEVDYVRFVDYQSTRWAPAVLDILFFLFTSVDEAEREGYGWRRILRAYEEELRSTLRLLKLEKLAPSMDRLLYDIEASAPFAAYAACLVLPLALDNRPQRWSSLPAHLRKCSMTGGGTVDSDLEEMDRQSEHRPQRRNESTPVKPSGEYQSTEAGDRGDRKKSDISPTNPVLYAIHSRLFRKKFPKVLKELDNIGAI